MPSSFRRFLLGMGAGALASYWLAQRALTPRYPDIALHAGHELTAAPRRVMAISPNPGDLEWFAAGTLSLLRKRHSTVVTTLLTHDGRTGREYTYDRTFPLGPQPKGELLPLIRSLNQEIRPDVIFTFDPEGLVPGWKSPDQVAAWSAVLSLLRAGIADGVRVYLYGTRRPNVTVDITQVMTEKEAVALAQRGQVPGPDRLTKQAVGLYNRIGQGRSAAFYAEAFYRLV